MLPVSAIKFVDHVVRDMTDARRVYESGLGLECIADEPYPHDARFRSLTFARRGEDFGMVRLVENPSAAEPVRNGSRPHDFGILTLNFRTNDIDAAHSRLASLGCSPISAILEYNVGKPMREVMFASPGGERLTIIEVGGPNRDLPVFSEAIATVGFVVPSMAESLRFYETTLGLTKAIAFQASGSPFDSLLGVGRLDRLDFATLTSAGNWTGKVELLELETDSEPAETTASIDKTGYFMTWFESSDPASVADGFANVGGTVIGTTPDGAILRAPGGEHIGIRRQR